MSKTAIQTINLVGVNLRRSTGSTYTTLTQDANANFITAAVNEAKRMVEDALMAWDWPGFRTQVTFSSTAATRTYDLSSAAIATPATNDRSRPVRDQSGRLQFWDVTTAGANFRLLETTQDAALNDALLAAQTIEKPSTVAVYRNATGLVAYFPVSQVGVRNYRLEVVQPQDDLAATSDVLTAPYHIVVLAATALSCEERGEELGMQASRWWDQYNDAMDYLLARDTSRADLVLIPE